LITELLQFYYSLSFPQTHFKTPRPKTERDPAPKWGMTDAEVF